MNTIGRLTAIGAILALLCTSCANGQGTVDLPVSGIDSDRASERSDDSLFDSLVTRGDEVIVGADHWEPGLHGDRLQYSPDAGRSWHRVLFDGSTDPGMPLAYLSVREQQWMVFGRENGQAVPFTSTDGRNFSRQAGTAFDGPAGLQGELLGTSAGWVFVGVEAPNGDPLVTRIYTSPDGASWTSQDADVAGLPSVGGGFRITDAAAGGGTAVVTGQIQGSNRITAQAFASSDGGKSWQNLSPDASGIGHYSNGFRSVEWTGTEFRFTGFAWPKTAGQLMNPHGMAAQWTPGGNWAMSLDESWSGPNSDFPWTPSISYGPSSALAIQERGSYPLRTGQLVYQEAGRPWAPLQAVPVPEEGEVRLLQDTAAVRDGFLLATAETRHGNTRRTVLHVAANGEVTDRTPPTGPGPAERKPAISSFAMRDGTTSAFGSVGTESVIWTLDGGQKVTGYASVVPDHREKFSSLHAGTKGLMILGYTRNETHVDPVVWSRADGGEWISSNSNMFGSSTRGDGSPVSTVLPSSHGFLAAGSYEADGTTNAALATSEDGRSWNRVWTPEFKGTAIEDRAITSLAETSTAAILAGGHLNSRGKQLPVVWTSPDAQSWKTATLPVPDGFDNASVVSVTAGAKAAVAVVAASRPGRPTRYVTYYSGDDGGTWSAGTSVTESGTEQKTAPPEVLAVGDGFVLVTSQGKAHNKKPLLLASADGRTFAPHRLSHPVLAGENLDISAAGTAGGQLLIAGHTGPDENRIPFCISVGLPGV
ncbi:hypothetical protein [Arthrobacter sp. CJ23]|uniref:hypothetical protein n=1 Tax=Arthrobacter sp. CJ23 TaxID=2972479 RepID=UPI00215BAF66|nr:hypothetical protein [Arthrobacter sp. CJ23]UVJ37883.1 hypothetical protein NVV90_11395 [Arthrobacter sp. CJ23]